jgi:hypothetical protein
MTKGVTWQNKTKPFCFYTLKVFKKYNKNRRTQVLLNHFLVKNETGKT